MVREASPQRSINNGDGSVDYCHSLTVSTTQANIVWTLITRHNINVCRIKPAQICTFSNKGRNLSVLLFNHVKYKLFLRQKILTDCQTHHSARLVWYIVDRRHTEPAPAAQAYRHSARSTPHISSTQCRATQLTVSLYTIACAANRLTTGIPQFSINLYWHRF